MAQTRYKQDMPPPGGYAKINIDRILPRSYFKSPYLLGGVAVVTVVMVRHYFKNRNKARLAALEVNDVQVSLQPFLLAERDRAYLKYVHRNYEEEKRIMADVPEWEVGTFYGEKIYKTAPPDYHMNDTADSVYAHVAPYDKWYQFNHATVMYLTGLEYKYKPKEEVETS